MPLQRHFDQLEGPTSWQSPLSVVAHIDLDAFYAQCQAVTAGIDPALPLGCRQWDSLIAVNYAAREYGVKRGMSVTEAREKCPEIKLPHVPTYAKGETKWTVDPKPSVITHKVSLDLFRRESRKIFKIFRRNCKIVEKAGIDEGFVDLGPEVHARAINHFPELINNNPGDPLPAVPSSVDVRFHGKLPLGVPDSVPNTWHDIFIAIASKLVEEIRLTVYDELHYTCSAGIASNKLLAKLGSGCNKPFNQTVVPSQFSEVFLDHFDLTDVWGWGGKAGAAVISALSVPETNQMSYIRSLSLSDLKRSLGDPDSAQSLFRTVRGMSQARVQARTTIKSMASVKNFRNALYTEDLSKWITVYCADLAGRLRDIEDDEGIALRPRVVSISSTVGGTQRSKQYQAPNLMTVAKEDFLAALESVAKKLVAENVSLPCQRLSIELSQIEEMPKQPLLSWKAPEDNNEDLYTCPRCTRRVPPLDIQEHADRHYVFDLLKSEQKQQAVSTRQPVSKVQKSSTKKVANRSKESKQRSLDLFFKKR